MGEKMLHFLFVMIKRANPTCHTGLKRFGQFLIHFCNIFKVYEKFFEFVLFQYVLNFILHRTFSGFRCLKHLWKNKNKQLFAESSCLLLFFLEGFKMSKIIGYISLLLPNFQCYNRLLVIFCVFIESNENYVWFLKLILTISLTSDMWRLFSAQVQIRFSIFK